MSAKKKVLAAASYVMVAALAVGGTMAYWTANDEELNVMNVGKGVDIELVEQQRTGIDGDLVDFQNGKEMVPLDSSAQGTKDKWGLPAAENYVDKIVSVENNGTTDAYVKVYVAVPYNLSGGDVASDAVVHVNWANRFDETGNGQWNTGGVYDSGWDEVWGTPAGSTMTIDGQDYYVECFTMKTVLEAGDKSIPVISGAYLDAGVDYDADTDTYTMDGKAIDYDFSQGVLIPVYVQAVQAEGFATAEEAFAAVQLPANPWENSNVVVDDADAKKEGSKYAGYVPTGGETIDGMVVADSTDTLNLRALYNATALDSGLTITNSYFRGQYAMNVTANEAADAVLTVSDTVLYGWTSFSGFDSATFTNCTFGEGTVDSTGSAYNYVRSYDETTFTNCEFKGSTLSVQNEKGEVVGDITLVNCTYNGKPITADMLPDIVDEWGVVDGVSDHVRVN